MALILYDLDPVHSQLGFSVMHLMITRVSGVFTKWTGSFAIDQAAQENSQLRVDIEAASVDTRNPQRDGHLRSPDFFDAEKFPTISFVTKLISPAAAGWSLTGDFTLRGVTLPVTFQVTRGGEAKDSKGQVRVGYQARGSISRKAFGVAWHAVYDGGSVVVGDEVELLLDLQLIPRGDGPR